MWNAATVVVCALGLVGRSEAGFPPVKFVKKAPVGVSPSAAGYTLPAEAHIVLVTSTSAFTRAQRAPSRCGDVDAIREIAGVLAHEAWHLRHGPDEEGAYDAQLIALLSVGAASNGPLFHKVMQAKRAVAVMQAKRAVAAKRAADAGVLARAATPEAHPSSLTAAAGPRRDGP